MSSRPIQFRGKEAVISAYEKRKCNAFSLWVDKQFLFKHAGTDAGEMLEGYLEMLSSNGSAAIYTLKVYDEISDTRLIKEKTEADGSFNFRLQEDLQYQGRDRELLSRIAALEKQISEGEEDEDQEEQGMLGQISTALQNPIIAGLFEKLTGIKVPGLPVAISGVEPGQENLTREAIEILKDKDPQLGTHLMKLANIAKANIDNFKYIINLLEQVVI